MRISDWSSDVCSSDLMKATSLQIISEKIIDQDVVHGAPTRLLRIRKKSELANNSFGDTYRTYLLAKASGKVAKLQKHIRSEEQTSELQSLMRISYDVFCLNKKKKQTHEIHTHTKHITIIK